MDPIQQTPYQTRLNALRQRMAANPAPCDTAWIIQPENRRYLSGFRADDSSFTESSGSLLINSSRSLLITDSRYTLEAKHDAVDCEVVTLKGDLMDELPPLLQRMETRALGFEQGYLTWGLHRKLHERLQDRFPVVDLVPLNDLVEEMREIKVGEEIGALMDAARLISDVLDKVVQGLKPGLTEREVAWQIEGLAREAGADGVSFPPIVASGPNSALPHATPTDRTLKAKEPVILDLGARLNGYCSDMTRTIFLGTPDSTFKRMYRTVHQAQRNALKAIQPLVESTFLDSQARAVIREAGFGDYFGHGLGHGVGLAVHERPRVGPRNPVKLREGTVFTIEPGIYIPGKGGIRLEEMVLMEKEGPKILTKEHHYYDF